MMSTRSTAAKSELRMSPRLGAPGNRAARTQADASSVSATHAVLTGPRADARPSSSPPYPEHTDPTFRAAPGSHGPGVAAMSARKSPWQCVPSGHQHMRVRPRKR